MNPPLHPSGFALVFALHALLGGPLAAQTAQSPLETLFSRLDRNGDGKLTGDEAPPAWRDAFDLNKDGVVTLEEARQAATAAPPPRATRRGYTEGPLPPRVFLHIPALFGG